MRSSFLPGLLIGVVLGAGGSLLLRDYAAVADGLPRSAGNVDASAWKSYRSTQKGFTLRYPGSYTLQETDDTVTLTAKEEAANGAPTSIVLEKSRDAVSRLVLPEMQLGSWKIKDRGTFALTTTYLTNDDLRTLSEIYLFVRDLPYVASTRTGVSVRATVTIDKNDPSFLTAKRAGGVHMDSYLTEPEQILSTFRFLQFNEL